jgi:mediator of replication checkpoint protein 1
MILMMRLWREGDENKKSLLECGGLFLLMRRLAKSVYIFSPLIEIIDSHIIAQNPKQQAFFKAIEDHDEVDFIDYFDNQAIAIHESQSDHDLPQDDPQLVKNPAPSLKRRASDVLVTSSGKENVPPGQQVEQSESFKKPRLVDIREQLSFLTEDSIIPDSQTLFSDDQSDGEDYHMTITRSNTSISNDSNGSNSAVVNRLSRTQVIEEISSSKPLAFQAAGAKAGSAFKISSLLRRATNLSTNSDSSNSTSTSNSNERSVRLGGSKKSNVHYHAYEAERRRTVDIAEQKRNAQLKKTVTSTKGRSIMGLLHKTNTGFD